MRTIIKDPFEAGFEPYTLVDLLRWRALHHPDRLAYTFLGDDEANETHLSYGELDRRARDIAVRLQSSGAVGKRVLLLYPSGLEFIAALFGCMYAGAIAVPVYPPKLNRPLPRLQAVAADAQASVAFTTTPILSKLRTRLAQAPDLQTLHWWATDDCTEDASAGWQDPRIESDNLAFLQYTSGSTGIPKGVMVSHDNLLYNLALIQHRLSYSPSSRIVSWLPLYHDLGLIGGILTPLFVGFPSALMSPLSFLQRPLRWLQAISRQKATSSGGPNFAYDLCVRRIKPEDKEALDLSSWTVAINGAEPVRRETIERFAASFSGCGFQREAFYPGYGLAEATLFVSGGATTDGPSVRTISRTSLGKDRAVDVSVEGEDTLTLVSSGRTLKSQRIVVVHPQSLVRQEEGQVGEVWVSGPSVAQGYWNRPEETERTFRARLAGTNEGPFLRTGDLGFMRDGELFVTGRVKDLIVIRGQNHYPQDIELTVESSHKALRPDCGAAFSIEVASEERLVIVQEVERRQKPDVEEVVEAVRQAVAEEHGLQVHAVALIKTGSVPKTSSGKIKRQSCRASFLEDSLEVVGEWREAAMRRSDASKVLPALDGNGESNPRPGPPTSREVEAWMVSRVAEQLEGAPEEVDVHQPFAYYGLDSLQVASVIADLEDWLNHSISPTLAWDYPTIAALSRHLAGETTTPTPRRPEPRAASQLKNEPIAVVGIGCRFPGADSPEAFRELLRNGRDAICEVPADRWDVDAFYVPDPPSPGKLSTRWGGFLSGIDRFDPQFFGISPREAASMDPQQRLLMEVAWEALESAGQAPDKLAGSDAGVFVGVSSNDYSHLLDPERIDAYSGTGNAHSITANRLSYLLDLRGPSVAVDTACSSSLVAVHLACQSLRDGESDLALAGGVNVMLYPELTVAFSQARMMAADGRCKTFDAAADGYVRGEGCGIVVLKRLSDALNNGDTILALLRGSAVNQDGRSNGLTAPNGLAQRAVIRKALKNAGVAPAQLGYIETHGTGTPLGDPIEVNALKSILEEDRSRGQRCALGSVKTNVGHLEAAAGIAGLIKTVLSLSHKEIYPHLHLRDLNPQISLENTPFSISIELEPWPADTGRRFAGISSFGFGGTNAHVVLEQAPTVPAKKEEPAGEIGRTPHLLPLSAKTESALKELAGRYENYLTVHANESLTDLCYTASAGRTHFPHRLAMTAGSAEEMRGRLNAFVSGQAAGSVDGHTRSNKPPKVAFLFTGQGSQYAGMGRQLYDSEPVFQEALDRCSELLDPYLERPLTEVLYPESGDNPLLNETGYTQPALFAVEYALSELWRSWGIMPDVVMGHSVGEYVAACVAGIFDLEDGIELIAERGRLMQKLPHNGAMAAVFDGEDRLTAAIAEYRDSVSIAAVNGPRNTVISGERNAVHSVLKKLQLEGVSHQELAVSHAFHSPLVEDMLDNLEEVAGRIRFEAPRIPLVSNLTGQIFGEGRVPDAEYWRRHARETVRFSAGIDALKKVGCGLFLEVGPNPTLLALGRRCLTATPDSWIPSLKEGQDDRELMLRGLGTLYKMGQNPDWSAVYSGIQYRRVSLPSYPFERKRYWIEPSEAMRQASTEHFQKDCQAQDYKHPLLGKRLESGLSKE